MTENERKPYVRYSISASIEDKGIAYAAKKAINTFLASHGFEGHITDFQPSSDSFTAVLELYDNGKCDFNVNALYEHLDASGRIPSAKDMKPKISIRPVQCNALITLEKPDYTAYEKTIEGLHRQAKEREESIRRLTDSLQERQQTLVETTERIRALENRLQSVEPRQFETPKKALLGSYLKQGLDVLLDVQCDVQELVKNGNIDPFIATQGRPMNLPLYLHEVYGLSITDERQFAEWRLEMEKHAKWEDTDTFKRSQERYKRFEADKSLLKTAEDTSASPEVISLLKKTLADASQHEEREEQVETLKRKLFERNKEVHGKLETITRDYESLRKVQRNSTQRRNKGASLPVFVEIYGEDQPGMTFTLPLIDKDSEYEKRLVNSCFQTSKGRGTASTNSWTEGEFYHWSINFLPETSEEDLAEASTAIIKTLLNEDLTNALGLKLRLISLREFEPRIARK